MAKSRKQLDEGIRRLFKERIMNIFAEDGEEVIETSSNEFCMPCLDEEGNERWVQVVVKVPTGISKNGNVEYDGYFEGENWKHEQAEKAAKKQEAERKKAEKMAKDAKARAERAEAKAKAKT